MEISHDSVTGFAPEDYTPRVVRGSPPGLTLKGGTVESVDDGVLDKPNGQTDSLIRLFLVGKHRPIVVKGINLMTLYYTDPHGRHQPINYRIYDKTTEQDQTTIIFREMLVEVLALGLQPAWSPAIAGTVAPRISR